jgi:hypothetical protein
VRVVEREKERDGGIVVEREREREREGGRREVRKDAKRQVSPGKYPGITTHHAHTPQHHTLPTYSATIFSGDLDYYLGSHCAEQVLKPQVDIYETIPIIAYAHSSLRVK